MTSMVILHGSSGESWHIASLSRTSVVEISLRVGWIEKYSDGFKSWNLKPGSIVTDFSS